MQRIFFERHLRFDAKRRLTYARRPLRALRLYSYHYRGTGRSLAIIYYRSLLYRRTTLARYRRTCTLRAYMRREKDNERKRISTINIHNVSQSRASHCGWSTEWFTDRMQIPDTWDDFLLSEFPRSDERNLQGLGKIN